MKLIKAMISLSCEDLDTCLLKTYEREVWIAEDTGLACTPYAVDRVPYLTKCDQWILTHVKSGYAIGPAFPPDKHFARIWLEEIMREGLDFNQNRWAIAAKKEVIAHQLRSAFNRTEARWAQVERERKKQEREAQAQQLSLFE